LNVDERRRWCGRRLTAHLDLHLRHPSLAFFGLAGERLLLAMCEEYSLWNHLYLVIDLNGGVAWSAHNAAEADIYLDDRDKMLFTPPAHQLLLGPILFR
jgi:hypothetical protein